MKKGDGESGKTRDNEGNAFDVYNKIEKEKKEALRKDLERMLSDGRSNKIKIRDFVTQKGYATRKELVAYFAKNIPKIMSEKTVDNNLMSLREEKTITLKDEDKLLYVSNYRGPLYPPEFTSESALTAYRTFKENMNYDGHLKKHAILQQYLNHNAKYKLHYQGKEDKNFYFSNENISIFALLINRLLYKCFLMNPDLFYRFKNKDDFFFNVMITVDISSDPNFDDFLEKYNEMKEIIFKKVFPTEAKKITTHKEIKEFVDYYEERQRAVAKFQHEKRNEEIEKILTLSISDREKSIEIQKFLRRLELETFNKFSVLRNQNFDDI